MKASMVVIDVTRNQVTGSPCRQHSVTIGQPSYTVGVGMSEDRSNLGPYGTVAY